MNDTPNLPQSLAHVLASPLNVKLAMVEHHMELARLLVSEILEEEVCQLAGERYRRDKPYQGRYSRWGSNPGSVRIDGERVPVEVPRVRDNQERCSRPLESYQLLHNGVELPDQLYKNVLLGLSTGDYGKVASEYVDGFGLSQSSVSRAFQERSRAVLEEFETRSLLGYDFVALWIDGKSQADQQIVIAMGLTLEGEKVPLGFIQASTENGASVKGLLQDLVDRGLRFDQGLLCVIDGAKALSHAVREVFGECGVIQRCQYHKRHNIISYLKEEEQDGFRRKIRKAQEQSDYQQAKTALKELHRKLLTVNRSAASSLMEGLEETLTIQRLGLMDLLGRSLKTTNCIENLNSQINKYTKKVKHWKNSDQRHRWTAAALVEAEGRMKRTQNWKRLPLLREALKQEIEERRRM